MVDDPSTPEQISPDELSFHASILVRAERIEAMQREIAETRGAMQVWTQYLADRYGLDDGDVVDNAGRIIRAAPGVAHLAGGDHTAA